jgi:hypothetical protein
MKILSVQKLLIFSIVVTSFFPTRSISQISFFNMPNPDMLPEVGYAYAEYDHYQSFQDDITTRRYFTAYVSRISIQATPYLEVGTNWWFFPDRQNDRKVVLATKWRIWLYQSDKYKFSMSPGSWQSFFLENHTQFQYTKHLFYNFLGLTIQHDPVHYTRLMLGPYGRFTGFGKSVEQKYGFIAGVEQRLSRSLVFVTDYFSGKGEGYGLAPGFVWYTTENGNNLPLYLAYQISNDPGGNVLLFEIGYLFRVFGSKK